MRTCHKMNIIFQTTGGYASSINGKSESTNKKIANITDIFYWNQDTRKKFGVLTISMTYGSPTELRIDCVVMLPTYYGMEQELHTNISKYGVWESTPSMDVLQERNLMIDHIGVILWDLSSIFFLVARTLMV